MTAGRPMQYDRDYFEGRTSFFYCMGGYRDVLGYFDRLANWFKPHAGTGPLLDVGCAYGFLMSRFNDGRRLEGCDVSTWAIEQAERLLPEARFRQIAPDSGLPYDDGSFGAVVCTDVLEHVDAPRQSRMLGELVRVLAPGGRFFMTTPNMGLMRRCLYRRPDRIEGHVGIRPMRQWEAELARHGLTVKESWTYLNGFLPGRFRASWLPECAIVAAKA
jgi:2-polyprenyl-3-methyl-5-hydroxy-6-metoxy-1,4-benzoquinol methylase